MIADYQERVHAPAEQMWQIGYRFQQVYQAIIDANWELGLHHWGKLRDVLNVALMKRSIHKTRS
jgi:hypothetical protein